MSEAHYLIGIDPGTNTGLAVVEHGTLIRVTSMLPCEAEDAIMHYRSLETIHVHVEDTRHLRLPRALQKAGDSYLKGVGSVHAEMRRWEQWLKHRAIPHTMRGLSPKMFRTGDAAWFARVTGYGGRTNEHGRAAAGLVWEMR